MYMYVNKRVELANSCAENLGRFKANLLFSFDCIMTDLSISPIDVSNNNFGNSKRFTT